MTNRDMQIYEVRDMTLLELMAALSRFPQDASITVDEYEYDGSWGGTLTVRDAHHEVIGYVDTAFGGVYDSERIPLTDSKPQTLLQTS